MFVCSGYIQTECVDKGAYAKTTAASQAEFVTAQKAGCLPRKGVWKCYQQHVHTRIVFVWGIKEVYG